MPSAYDYIERGLARNFRLDEWPDPVALTMLDSRVLEGADALRDRVGRAIHPSQHLEGFARTTGSQSSRHFAGSGRMSDAGDWFPTGDIMEWWLAAVEDRRWGGIGVYLDTAIRSNPPQPTSMLHLDLRPGPRLFWVRNETGEYIYHTDRRFWKALSRAQRGVQ